MYKLFLKKELEAKNYDKALKETRRHRKDAKFVCFQDTSDTNLENCYEYRYRGISKKNFTLLHYAAVYGQEEMIKVLMKNGASKIIASLYLMQ